MASEKQKASIDFSNAKEAPRTIDPNAPEAAPLSENQTDKKGTKLPDDALSNEDGTRPDGSQVLKANISGG
ncbi:MAG: hypothetical protein IGS39_01580 [Calothrix sp. C42_A2020_038]|nr:hypothetical protein [Calothrix sp. C42_A2020_038]